MLFNVWCIKREKCKGMRFMEAKIQKYKWDDLNLKKLSLNINHFTDSSFFLEFYISPESVLYLLLVPVL